jgi:ribosomal protein S7
MVFKLSFELVDIAGESGNVIQKKKETHKVLNKAFAQTHQVSIEIGSI